MYPTPQAPTPAAPLMPAAGAPPGMTPYMAGGLVRTMSNAQMDAEARSQAQADNNTPLIQGLAAHVKQCWSVARQAKMMTIEGRMLQAVRQRRGEYDPEVIAEIRRSTGGSEVYMMLTSNKCRAAASWIRDVVLGQKESRPWAIDPTPLPDLPPAMSQTVTHLATQEAMQFEQATGVVVGQPQMQEVVARIKDRIVANAKKRAREAADRMADKMEDQLVEGDFPHAFAQFIDDLVTFPSALIKGPVIRKKKRLAWVEGGKGGYEMKVEDKMVLTWGRVDPFMAYPSPAATDIQDGFFIERHQLSRSDISELIGVEGYKDDAIRGVLDEFGRNGLKDWLWIDAAKADVEGKSLASIYQNPDGLIDALQFWGSVQGKMLIEWGMDEKEVPDPLKEYECEVWTIGSWVIKAMLNADPLSRRPYYKASYEEIPGTFWGNAVTDLCRDTQVQCNTAARAIANNMNLASGPQVSVNVDRLPAGEDITQLYPWRIWQTTSDPYGNTTQPAVDFFMPTSVANELMQIYTFFSNLADEHTGVPRYMTGDSNVGGAGRTASGMSMLMGNAGKAIKQVIANIDVYVLERLIDRLYYYNMRYSEDNELKGDVCIRARGATALLVKEQHQVRINEFLGIVATNPIFVDIVGEEAIAALLREGAKLLDLDTDQIVPPPEVIRARLFQKQLLALQMQNQQAQAEAAANQPDQISLERDAKGAVQGAKIMPANRQKLKGGAPITDNFAPSRAA